MPAVGYRGEGSEGVGCKRLPVAELRRIRRGLDGESTGSWWKLALAPTVLPIAIDAHGTGHTPPASILASK